MKLSERQLSIIQKKLLERAESLTAMKKRASRDATAEVESMHPDEIDLARAQETAESSRVMAEALRLELLQVEGALSRLRTGSFGICEDCDTMIPTKRLEIRPEARLCIDCQSEEERHFGRGAFLGRGDLAFAS